MDYFLELDKYKYSLYIGDSFRINYNIHSNCIPNFVRKKLKTFITYRKYQDSYTTKISGNNFYFDIDFELNDFEINIWLYSSKHIYYEYLINNKYVKLIEKSELYSTFKELI